MALLHIIWGSKHTDAIVIAQERAEHFFVECNKGRSKKNSPWAEDNDLRLKLQVLIMFRAVPVLNDCMLLAAGWMVSWNIRHSPLSSKQIACLAVNVQWLCIRTSLPCKRSSLKRELRWHQHFNISEDNKIMNRWALNRYSALWSCKTITIYKIS